MQRFTQLKVWQRSHLLAIRIHVLTQEFPSEERYGLTAQLRRAVTSVPTNIAVGSRCLAPSDYSRFLNIAQGFATEAEELLLLCRDMGFMAVETAAPFLDEVDHVCRMLEALRQRVDREGRAPTRAPTGAPINPRTPGPRSTLNAERRTRRPNAHESEVAA